MDARKNMSELESVIQLGGNIDGARSDQNVVITETRDFYLNEQKAIDKKIKFTDRDDIHVEESGGGLKILLNTGMYELIKSVIDKYYNNDSQRYCYTYTPVIDNRGNTVETKYKISKGKTSLYTLNMYHTKCSYLVNGRDPGHFLRTDLVNLLEIVMAQLQAHDSSVTSTNSDLRNLLIHLKNSKMEVEKTNDDLLEIHDLCGNNNDVQNLHMLTQDPNTQNTQNGQVNHDTRDRKFEENVNNQTSMEVPNSEKIFDMLKCIKDEITELRSDLSNHINTHNAHISQLRDELAASKNHTSVCTKQTQNSINTLCDDSRSISLEIKNNTDTIQRKLQSTIDLLKNIDKRDQIEKSKNQKQSLQEEALINGTNYEETSSPRAPRPCTPVSENKKQPPLKIREDIKTRTLIIGSSILKGISRRGLDSSVDITTLRGAGVNQVTNHLQTRDLSPYKTVILYVGGNDVSDGMSHQQILNEITKLASFIRQTGCSVFICSLLPRDDTDVSPLNEMLKHISGTSYIDMYDAFVYGDGNAVRFYYHRDGIHLNPKGTSNLVRQINACISILKTGTLQKRQSPVQNRRANYQHHRFQNKQLYDRNAGYWNTVLKSHQTGGKRYLDYKQLGSRQSPKRIISANQHTGAMHSPGACAGTGTDSDFCYACLANGQYTIACQNHASA